MHRYVQLARMKRASYLLAYSDAESVTDIAMDAGYDAPDAFARAFRQRFGQSPSSFRNSPLRSTLPACQSSKDGSSKAISVNPPHCLKQFSRCHFKKCG